MMSKWYVKAIFIVLGLVTLFLVIKSFREGFEEGVRMKELEIEKQKMKWLVRLIRKKLVASGSYLSNFKPIDSYWLTFLSTLIKV